MNIALLHYAAPPIVGGVESVIARQARQLVRAGHQVRIIAGRGETWDAQIPVVVLPRMDFRHPDVLRVNAFLDAGDIPVEFEELVQKITRVLRRSLEGINAVFVHNIASTNKNLALTAAVHQLSQSLQNTRFILFHHEMAWLSTKKQQSLYPEWPWNLLCTPWQRARQVVPSKPLQRDLAGLMHIHDDQILIIPDGLDLIDFLGLSLRSVALLEKLPITMSAPILLSPVRITTRKNLELSMRVLDALRKKHPDAILIITGPAGTHSPYNVKYFKKLKKLRASLKLEGAIFMLAESLPEGLPEVCMSDFYRISDALLLTSKAETVGATVLEAGLARLPIFCTDLPVFRNLTEGNAVYFSPEDKPEAIAERIANRLESDPGYQLRKRIRQEFTWDAIYQSRIIRCWRGKIALFLERLSGFLQPVSLQNWLFLAEDSVQLGKQLDLYRFPG